MVVWDLSFGLFETILWGGVKPHFRVCWTSLYGGLGPYFGVV